MVAITPHKPEFSREMTERHDLGFDLLTDPGNEYVAKLGIRFRVPDYIEAIYTQFGINLPERNGDDSWTLPIPTRLVVDQSGIVRAADIDPDYTRRPEPEKTLADLAALG